MKTEKTAVIIGVHSRIYDANSLLRIIKKRWNTQCYDVFVVHCGAQDGYEATEAMREADRYIELSVTAGQTLSPSDALFEGLKAALGNPEYTSFILTTGDTWIINDSLIAASLKEMRAQNKHIATGAAAKKRAPYNGGFFILDAEYTRHYPDLSILKAGMESAFTMRSIRKEVYTIKSMRPIYVPRLLGLFKHDELVVGNGQFRIFPKAQVLTHYIEDMGGGHPLDGLRIKQGLANTMAGEKIFPVPNVPIPFFACLQPLSRYIPQ